MQIIKFNQLKYSKFISLIFSKIFLAKNKKILFKSFRKFNIADVTMRLNYSRLKLSKVFLTSFPHYNLKKSTITRCVNITSNVRIKYSDERCVQKTVTYSTQTVDTMNLVLNWTWPGKQVW